MDEIDRMDMLGFLKIRAWNAKKEHVKKQPQRKFIDEVWGSIIEDGALLPGQSQAVT